MQLISRRQRIILFTALTLFTLVGWWFAVQRVKLFGSASFTTTLAYFDMTLAVPLAWYALMVRRDSAAPLSIVPVFVASSIAANFLLPSTHSSALLITGAMLELSVVAFVITQIRKAAASSAKELDTVERIRNATRTLLGNNFAADAVSTEIAFFWLALFSWHLRPQPQPNHFTFHRRSGWPAIAGGLILAVIAESIAIHLWIGHRFPALSIVLALLDVYSILWLLADARAFALRATTIDSEKIDLRFGNRWNARISWSEIEGAEAVKPSLGGEKELDAEQTGGVKPLKLALLERPTILLRLQKPTTIAGMYGIRKKTSLLALATDDDARFEQILRSRGLWRESASPSAAVSAATKSEPISGLQRLKMTREAWLRLKPDYIAEEEWMRFYSTSTRQREEK